MSGTTADRTPAWPRWVLALSVAVALSSAIPHAWQARTCPADEVFTGFVEAHNDQNLYLMWARQAQAGRVLMDNLATAEQAPPMFAGPQWVALGMLARIIPIPLVVLYRIIAVALAFIYLLILWRLISEVFRDPSARLFAFVIGALGSGFGAICDAINAIAGRTVIFSADLMPELWAYHSFLLPHFTLTLCFMALLTLTLLRAWRAPSMRLSFAAAGWALLLIAVHPYDIVVWGPLLVLHTVVCVLARVPVRTVAVNAWALAGAAIPAAAYALQSKTHPMIAVWTEQNLLRSPALYVYLIGMGAPLLLAILGRGAMREEPAEDAPPAPQVGQFLVLWALVSVLMAYSYPLVPFERRAVEGIHIPLALLAGAGMAAWVLPRLRSRRLAMALLLVAILPTNVMLLVRGAGAEQARIPLGMVRGFEWIEANTAPDARVFTSMTVGQYCCRYALRHVFVGHLQVTVDPPGKQALAEEFFAVGTAEARRREILRASGCGWVAATPEQASALAGLPWLEEARNEGALVIYRFPEAGLVPELTVVTDANG